MQIISLVAFFIFVLDSANANWKDLHLVNGCNIFSPSGEIVKPLPGNFCQFYDDGNLLVATETALKMMDKFQAVKWELKGKIHHQLNKSADGKRILALGYKPVENKNNTVVDKFMVISLDGKVLLQSDSSELLKQVKFKTYTPKELTHINSFYEIPKLISTRVLPDYLKEGNFILNSFRSGIFILSADLKKVLHNFTLPSSLVHQVHDVQVLENGNLLYFNNMVTGQQSEGPHSSIEEYDLVENKTVLEFTSNPKQMFFSLFCGGVQQLDQDLVLFSHMLTGTYVFSRKNNRIESSIHGTHFMHGRFFPSQQVKSVDLKKFLSHWSP
jgi:hypothetical protein